MLDPITGLWYMYQCNLLKAFDFVPHARLLSKLKAYSIGGHLLKWILDFVIGREQCVVLNGCKSNRIPVRSGLPQGTVLGPILFIIYFNHLSPVVNSQCVIFADEIKLYQVVHSDSDVFQLQRDLDALCEWSSR